MLGGEVRLRNVANLGNDGLEATAREDGADYVASISLRGSSVTVGEHHTWR